MLSDMIEFKDPYLLPRPPLTGFSKCYYLDYFGAKYYDIFLSHLYQDDFLYVNCITRLLTENDEFELYCFLCQLNNKGVSFQLYTPVFDFFLRELYSKEFNIFEVYPSHSNTNPKGKEYTYLNITNYLH